jgi:hypothetical protein
MTKEEIINECYGGGFDPTSGWMFDGNVDDVYLAMEKYAKLQVVAFNEWVVNLNLSHATDSIQNGYWFYPLGQLLAAKNTEELYSIFLKETNK